jgi:lipoate-protein ligase A
MPLHFRLIQDAHRDGAHNMAVDEAVSQAVSAGAQAPTLRLYGWAPPAISIGSSQRFASVDALRCEAEGVGIVRRSTGGLAILHTDEFTYAVALPKEHVLAQGDVLSSYRRISEAIMAALTRLGVREVQANRVAKEDKAQGPVCFEAPSDYEVIGMTDAGLKKLVGSAQWRRVDAVLQHGSLPLSGDIARICSYLSGAPEPERVRKRAGTLSEALGKPVSWESVAAAWRDAFAETLDIVFETAPLSEQELAHADSLMTEKYANDAWNRRR